MDSRYIKEEDDRLACFKDLLARAAKVRSLERACWVLFDSVAAGSGRGSLGFGRQKMHGSKTHRGKQAV
jgi:hypothetical protein